MFDLVKVLKLLVIRTSFRIGGWKILLCIYFFLELMVSHPPNQLLASLHQIIDLKIIMEGYFEYLALHLQSFHLCVYFWDDGFQWRGACCIPFHLIIRNLSFEKVVAFLVLHPLVNCLHISHVVSALAIMRLILEIVPQDMIDSDNLIWNLTLTLIAQHTAVLVIIDLSCFQWTVVLALNSISNGHQSGYFK